MQITLIVILDTNIFVFIFMDLKDMILQQFIFKSPTCGVLDLTLSGIESAGLFFNKTIIIFKANKKLIIMLSFTYIIENRW